MIWDIHCHLSGVEGSTPEERMARLIEFADRMGIERLVVFMGRTWSYDPRPDDFRRQNDEAMQAIAHWRNRAFGFAYLNPNYVNESLAELDRCVKEGPFVGIKLWVAKKCSAPELDPIIQRAGELNALVYQHTWLKSTGNLPGESTPMDLAALAARHPTVPLICGHAGGDWERGIRAIRASPNVSLETAGFDPTAGVVEMAVRELGAERVVYGSDAGGRSFASQLAKVQSADIPEGDRQRIFGGNLRRLLAPILQAKGIKA